MGMATVVEMVDPVETVVEVKWVEEAWVAEALAAVSSEE